MDFTFTTKKKSKVKPWSVTEIVAAEYCEQKALFDLKYGDRPSDDITQKRIAGTADHDKFEAIGKVQLAEQQRPQSDRRCFIASSVFGSDAPQTNYLRYWRDTTLLSNPLGRRLVKIYYFASPSLTELIKKTPGGITLTRKALNLFIRWSGGK